MYKNLLKIIIAFSAFVLLLSGCGAIGDALRDAANPEPTTAIIGLGESVVFQGFEMSVGNAVEFANVTGGVVARVPITFTNVGSSRNWPDTIPAFTRVWNPGGVSVSANMQSDSSALLVVGSDIAGSASTVTIREGSSHSTMINFVYGESGIYEIQFSSTLMWENEIHRVYIRVNVDRWGTTNHETQTAETESETIGNASSLDERLFGVWVEQGDFPEWVILTRGFNSDGTGFFWGDGPGYEFTWWTDGNVLTIEAYQEETDSAWIDIFRYEIDGDTMQFIHGDGWQRVYHRDDGL